MVVEFIYFNRFFQLVTFDKDNVVVKIAPFGNITRNFHSRARRFSGLSIPGRDIDFMSCSVLYLSVHCSHFVALSIPFLYNNKETVVFE